MIDRLRPFAINGLRVLLVDRGVLFVDFFIATGVAFLIQFFVWSAVYDAHEEIRGFTQDRSAISDRSAQLIWAAVPYMQYRFSSCASSTG